MTSISELKKPYYLLTFDLVTQYGIENFVSHYGGVIMGAIASQMTSLTIVYWDANQRKHQSSASLAYVWGFHREPVNSPHKWSVTRKMFPFDDVIMPLVYIMCWSFLAART